MLKQSLQQKLQQRLSPQQIQLMKLVQLPTLAFEQRIKEEMEENPALENVDDEYDDSNYESASQDEFSNENDYDDYGNEHIDADDIDIDAYLSDDDTPSYKTQTNNYSEDDDDKSVPFVHTVSFQDHLLSQLHTYKLSDEEYLIAEFIIGNLDDDGYLRREIIDIADDLLFSQGIETEHKTIEYLLENFVQKLDPNGVGARDLQECLLLQLQQKEPTDYTQNAIEIVQNYFDLLAKKHYEKLQQKLNIGEQTLKQSIHEIEKLNPKPGKVFDTTKTVEHIIPDFTIKIIDGELELSLNGRNAPELHISRDYTEMFETYKESEHKSNEQKKAVQFVKQKLDAAKWFIDAVKQRQQTLYATMHAIMLYQKEYFLTGDELLIKPMILKDISDIIQMDISTVSRVANSKYVNTPYGTLLIKNLFSESMTNEEGDEVSTREIKKILESVITEESKKKPLTDEKLTTLLKEKGYNIARRTVAKYREQLNIPVARLRKEL